MGVAGYIKLFVGIGIMMLVVRNADLLAKLSNTFDTILTSVTHLGDRTA
jgi:hypothetical protein